MKSLDSFSRQLCWLRFYMQPQLGEGLPQLLIGIELRHLSVDVCGLVSTGQATQPWRSSLLTMTITSSGTLLYNEHHVLKQLLPGVTNHQYHLRQRRHNHCLTVKTDDRNFVTRHLFKDLYWHWHYTYIFIHLYIPQLRFVNCFYSFNEWMNEWMNAQGGPKSKDTFWSQIQFKTSKSIHIVSVTQNQYVFFSVSDAIWIL